MGSLDADNPVLVVLAAGIGRRYGSSKQMESVGPGGSALMEYTIYDAIRAGFGRVVFVIRPEMQELIAASIGRLIARHVPVHYAHQRLDALPDGQVAPSDRQKPWGTGHAVLCAKPCVAREFAVVNADDFYGFGAILEMRRFLTEASTHTGPTGALVAYRLSDTLPADGTVSRGLCRVSADGWLTDVVETAGIGHEGSIIRYVNEANSYSTLSGDTPVSMNLWGFHTDVFALLASEFTEFLTRARLSASDEFQLPMAIRALVESGRIRFRVLSTTERWFGMTNPLDRAVVSDHLAALVAAGRYPRDLWS